MRREFIATVVTLALCAAMLVGCGGSTGASASYETPASTEDIPIGNNEIEEPTLEVADNYQEEMKDGVDFVRSPEEDIVAWNEDEIENDEDESLIVLAVDKRQPYDTIYSIVAINPDTGVQSDVASFQFDEDGRYSDSEGRKYSITSAYEMTRYANYRDQFSIDYTKAAANLTFIDTGEKHAGWIAQDGTFFDVTVALGEQPQSYFDEPVYYQTIGFTDDGYFIYASLNRGEVDECFIVEVDNVVPGSSKSVSKIDLLYQDGVVPNYDRWEWFDKYRVTSRIDEFRWLADFCNTDNWHGVILDTATWTAEEYLPKAEHLYVWNAILSPDGEMVAFFSAPKPGSGNISIYLIPLEGGEPTEITADYVIPSSRPVKISGSSTTAYLLEWR